MSKDIKDKYRVSYDDHWKEWNVYNDLVRTLEGYENVQLYGFPTREEAIECSRLLNKWHYYNNNSSHPSVRWPSGVPRPKFSTEDKS